MASPRPAAGRTALFILGAPGSGASMLARVLEATGVARPADPGAMSAFNDRLLVADGAGWTDPFGSRPREGGATERAPDELAQARGLLRTAEPHQPLLVLADPRHTRLAPLWTAALEAEDLRIGFILMVRPPAEAAAALKAAEGVTRNRGLLLWASYMLEAERVARGGRRVAVAFDRLVADPEAELDRIERGLDVRLPRRTWDSAAEVEALLRDEAAPARPALPAALAPLQDLYAHLQAAAQDEPENTDTAAETARWFASLTDVMAPVLHQIRREGGDAASAGDRREGDDPARKAELEVARAEAKEAAARAEAAEARIEVVQAALTVARRRSAEAETLLQARATEASAGERDARAALATAVSARDSALDERDAARAERDALREEHDAAADERDSHAAERDAVRAERDAARAERNDLHAAGRELASELGVARAAAADLELRLAASEEDSRSVEREIADERMRHDEARERLALTGLTSLAAQARVRELQSQLEEARDDLERRRRWLPRLFGWK